LQNNPENILTDLTKGFKASERNLSKTVSLINILPRDDLQIHLSQHSLEREYRILSPTKDVAHERLTFSASEKAKKVLLSANSGSTLFMKKCVAHDKLLLLVFPAG
jgi:hypothetical protein